ncbi:MAG TPA: hypothetical protein VHI31_04105 [Actinomycetota bacterium]|nr:hypothetical protein [Actinomycetota bacterium]
MNVPDSAEPLFELPPEEFTAERDRIAKELKKQGDDDAAASVKALKRPSVTAYALNLVSRKDPGLIEALLDADQSLRTAKSRAEMDSAKAERQKAISSISGKATDLLSAQERPVTAQVRERLTETLLAVATDDATRELLRTGRLLKEAEAGGFGGPVTAFESAPPGDDDGRISERASKLRSEAEGKLAEAKKAKSDSERAAHEAKELAEAAAAAEERARKLMNLARKAEELGNSKMAEADELESRGD